MRVAVVGHLEWTEFAPVARVPAQGEIANAADSWFEPAGGGAVAAVQLARLGAECTFYTALGDDDIASRAGERLAELGLRVEAVSRSGKPTRRAFTFVDEDGERTITTIGERLQPELSDDLPWHELDGADAVFFVAGGADVLGAARAARVLTATARVMDTLERAHVELDAVIGSGSDASERYRPIDPEPRYVVATAGAVGGSWTGSEGRSGDWAAVALDAPVADAYGCGDSFAAGLTFGLARDGDLDAALAIAARCGATCLTGRGPYGRQLTGADL